MKQTLNIVPECFIDTILAETLLESNRCNHQKGVGAVINTITGVLKDKLAIGIIDNDKKKPKEFNNYIDLQVSPHFSVMRHKENHHHYLIVIKPAQEAFILSCASEAKVKLSDYNLPEDLEGLKKKTKSVMSKENVDFKRLFKALRKTGEMKQLSEILNNLLVNAFASDPGNGE